MRSFLALVLLGAVVRAEGPLPAAPQVVKPEATPDYSAIEVRVVAVAAGKPDFEHVRGTAFLVGPRGLLATAQHVVVNDKGEPLPNLFILRPTPPNITASPAVVSRLVAREEKSTRDIAFLQVKRSESDPDLPYFEIGADPGVGEQILTSGYPLVFDRVYRWPLFRFGRVSSTRYFLRDSKVLVLDMVSAGGFSGAPVIRMSDGRVLGVQKGGATGNPNAGFSIATEIRSKDVDEAVSAQNAQRQ